MINLSYERLILNMTEDQLTLLKALGFIKSDTPQICSICKENIFGGGMPLPGPCSICGQTDYCVKCSSYTCVNNESKYYCSKHSVLEML